MSFSKPKTYGKRSSRSISSSLKDEKDDIFGSNIAKNSTYSLETQDMCHNTQIYQFEQKSCDLFSSSLSLNGPLISSEQNTLKEKIKCKVKRGKALKSLQDCNLHYVDKVEDASDKPTAFNLKKSPKKKKSNSNYRTIKVKDHSKNNIAATLKCQLSSFSIQDSETR